MATSIKSPDLMLVAFALLSPTGILLAVVVHPELGGALILVGLGLGVVGLHHLGRRGPH